MMKKLFYKIVPIIIVLAIFAVGMLVSQPTYALREDVKESLSPPYLNVAGTCEVGTSGVLDVNGDFQLLDSTNGNVGTVELPVGSPATVTVTNTRVDTGSYIILTRHDTLYGNTEPYVSAVAAGSFTISTISRLTTAVTYVYQIVND